MKALQHLQQAFQDYLLAEESDFRQHIVDGGKISADKRLEIYANAYCGRLVDVLAANYPMLSTFMGEDTFTDCAYAYVVNHPSSFRNIRWFGDKLALYLKDSQSTWPAEFLSEFAQFEWSLSKSFDAADHLVCDVDDMAAILPEQWPQMSFSLHSSVQRLDCQWNVVTAWKACQAEQAAVDCQQLEHPMPWVIWRQQQETKFRSLEVDEAWALDEVMNGACFADLCAGLGEWIDEEHIAMRAASLLKTWLHEGMVTAISVES